MKSNIYKFLSKSLSTYIFLLVIIFIMKLVGLDYFGLDTNNSIILKVNLFLSKNWVLRDILYFIPLWLNQFVMVSVSANSNSKKMVLINIITIPFYYLLEVYKLKLFGVYSTIVEMLYFLSLVLIYKKKINFKTIKRFLFVVVGIFIVQAISTFTRFRYSFEYVESSIENLILNLDYILMLIMIYKINFMKGVETKCYQEHQYLSLLKKINLKKLLTKLQRNLDSFKKLNKVDKLTYIIYLQLSLLWNTLSVILILLVAKLNNTFIECIFILTSFWLSKRQFGKPFHLKSMSQCFVVSNLTYYILNRVTTPLGISIFIPILLGVSLSYFTSKLVKSENPKLYRGIPIDEFDKKILKVTDKNSLHYKICYMYYIERKSELEISHKTNYSIDNIKKIKSKINKNIEKLQ